MVACAELLFNYYERFAQEAEWGDPQVLRRALDQVWEYLHGAIWDYVSIARVIDNCEQEFPDSEDFSSQLASNASNAASVVIQCVQACLDENPQLASNVVFLVEDCIYNETMALPPNLVGNEFQSAFDQMPEIVQVRERLRAMIYLIARKELLSHSFLTNLQRAAQGTAQC